MQTTKLLMGMPITVAVVDQEVRQNDLEHIFTYFTYIDNTFSTYKPESEISRINRGEISRRQWSRDMREVFRLSERTREETKGFFNIRRGNAYDPSGLVKGWAVYHAARMLEEMGFGNYYVDAGGDIQVRGQNDRGNPWRIGIRNPFNRKQVVKIISLEKGGVATSGTYIRGQHVYNPFAPGKDLNTIVSLTVVGETVYDADRFATAAFAMQEEGVSFIGGIPGFEAYAIDSDGKATFTSGFTSSPFVPPWKQSIIS